ncbi:alpha/beta fold hydrolase [Uliginosibacterium sp. sgz301328]|uniref:alpha/beta fold hydrolase n=1 Tax=Uliginosibacterium sp. sgz301328 TaxID=3243764 RepID=UPI00359CC575
MHTQTERIQLVMLPGLVNDERLWERQASDLSDIVDTQIADISTRDSIGELAEEVLAHAPARFALVGLSMGGYVAMEIMRRAPERVIGLALCDTNAHADTPEATARRRHRWHSRRRILRRSSTRWRRACSHRPTSATPDS